MLLAALIFSALLTSTPGAPAPGAPALAIQAPFSDEFDGTALDGRWRFVNPLGDAAASLAGGQLRLALPAGSNHDAWYPTNTAPRLLQDAPDTDFILEAKFDAALTQTIQGHGLLVEETPTRFLRFDLYRAGGRTYAYAALVTPSAASSRAQRVVASSTPAWARVERTGAHWRFLTSTDGQSWTEVAAFDQALQVAAVGVMAGNYGSGGPAPAYTARVDYFHAVTPPPDGDTVPPVLGGVSITPDAEHARIDAATNEPATVRVEYGPTTAYGNSVQGSPLQTTHTLLLTGLSPSTLYHARLTATDASGNAQTDADRTFTTAADGGNDAPTLVVWHGDQQRVGHLGSAQDDFNLMGNVSDPDGIASLTYRLNGGPARTLTVGDRPDGFGDGRRLAATGDFDADLPIDQLQMGTNTVELRAVDARGAATTHAVSVSRQTGSAPLPVSIDWSAVSDPQDVGQYVDGQWRLNGDGLRILRPGYDRIFLIGERTWQDYEVTVPVTIHSLQIPTGPYSASPGVGLLMRFAGHIVGGFRNWPDAQPKWGYQPFGAIGWIQNKTGLEFDREFYHGDSDQTQHFGRVTISLGGTYWMKMRCTTLPDAPDGRGVTRYRFKMWASDQSEPADWDWDVTQTSQYALRQGGAALLAHHVEATFGDVTITPLSGGDPPDTTPPTLSGITAEPAAATALVRWTTDEPATSTVAYGPTTAYEDGTMNTSTLTTAHSASLTGLTSETPYHYRVSSTDAQGNTAQSGDLVFTTLPGEAGPPAGFSDDFDGTALDGRWRFVNPLGDAAASLAGGQLRLALPAGSNHDAWYPSSTAPRLLQDMPDTDFILEAKFDAALTQTIQGHGLVAEASDGRFLRFDLYRHGGQTYAYAALVTTSAASTRANRVVASGTPAWLRMERTGTHWTLLYSTDGTTWTSMAAFDQALPVAAVGVMAGNYGSGGPAPAYTARVDYFRSLPLDASAPAAVALASRTPVRTSALDAGAPALSAVANGQDVVLTWSPDLPGGAFEIEQSTAGGSETAGFKALATVPVAPYQTEHYTYRVSDLPPGTHQFRLKLLDVGAAHYSQTATVEVAAAAPFTLTDPSPNPFAASAAFSLAVAKTQHVRIDAYNVLGQRVASLFEGTLVAGTPYTFRLEGAHLPSGLYFIRVRGTHFAAARKTILAK